jgi:hypothetical protein
MVHILKSKKPKLLFSGEEWWWETWDLKAEWWRVIMRNMTCIAHESQRAEPSKQYYKISLPSRVTLQIFKHSPWWETAHGQPGWNLTREIWTILALAITPVRWRLLVLGLFQVILHKALQPLESLCFPANQRCSCYHRLPILRPRHFKKKVRACEFPMS